MARPDAPDATAFAGGPVTRHDTGRIKILIVDDHPIVRKGLSQLIAEEPDMAICGETESPARATPG